MQWLQHGAGLINRREKRGEKITVVLRSEITAVCMCYVCVACQRARIVTRPCSSISGWQLKAQCEIGCSVVEYLFSFQHDVQFGFSLIAKMSDVYSGSVSRQIQHIGIVYLHLEQRWLGG